MAESGCGMCSFAMVLSYLKDSRILPTHLAEMYYGATYFNETGTARELFIDTQSYWGINVQFSLSWDAWYKNQIIPALENNQPIIVQCNLSSPFTSSTHYIVLAGLTKDKKIIVLDPNGYNYNSETFFTYIDSENIEKTLTLKQGFEEGFPQEVFSEHVTWYNGYWIFNKKGNTDIPEGNWNKVD